MLRFSLLFALLASSTTIGCASGPKGEAAAAAMPAVQAGKSRIVFYRTSGAIGALDQPNLLADGFVIGKSEPGYFSYADLAPGTHAIECKGGGDASGGVNRISVQTPAGTTTYLETSVKAAIDNFKVNIEPKPEPEAKQKIAKLKFRPPTNPPPPTPAATPAPAAAPPATTKTKP